MKAHWWGLAKHLWAYNADESFEMRDQQLRRRADLIIVFIMLLPPD